MDGWQSDFEFSFNPISEIPSEIAVKLVKTANRLKNLIAFIDTKPVGPNHPYQDYLQCGLLDKDLEEEYINRFGEKDRLTKEETTNFLKDMWNKYPKMRELYPIPQSMVKMAEQNSKDNWFYKLRPE